MAPGMYPERVASIIIFEMPPTQLFEKGSVCICHSGENRNPGQKKEIWIPASAGMTSFSESTC
jgi:hypothetical protein